MALKRVNAVVVGAGAGGGVVAKELACAGLNVVLLERGKWYTAFDCRKDDLRNQRTTALGCGFGPDEERDPRVVVDGAGHERTVKPSDGSYSNNAACVGGGTFSYGAMAWRFMRQDFRMRSTYGAVDGSTLEDWPISYEDLEPYYEKAEWEIGVSGDDSPNIFKAPRKKPLPMPPLADSTEHVLLESAAKRLGLHPFHIPMLRNTVPFNGRGACMRWYNRAGVEHVMGFCTESEYLEFLHSCPEFERMLVRSGIILLKYWFSVSDEEQERRFQERMRDVTKRWKLSPMDLESRRRWVEYSRARCLPTPTSSRRHGM